LTRLASLRQGETLVRVLGPVGWVIIVAGGISAYFAAPPDSLEVNQPVLLVTMGLFFVTMLIRVIVAAVIWQPRRVALLALAGGIVLWALASAGLNAATPGTPTSFPSPGEVVFLASYIGFVAFILLDASSRSSRAETAWLDAAIVVGGTGAVAGALLLTPFATVFPEGGLPLLIAVLYPLIDLVLALLVVGQWALAARSGGRRTLTLILGFVVLAIADTSLVLNLSTGTYGFTMLLDMAWGVSFMLIVGAAVAPKPPQVSVARRLPGAFLVGSFIVAILLMLIRPDGVLGWAIGIPAAVTLLATGARLVIALRDSRHASEAIQMAQTDDLTGLPNRRAVLKALDDGITAERPLGLMLLDLDGFKEVNDTLGHSAGDTLLELIALRMRDALPPETLLARIGGDEFAIVTQHDDELDLLEQAQAIRQTLLAPAKVDGMDLAMHASLGITVREPGDTRAADMLRRSDIAMYEAKVTRAGAQLYDAQRDEFSRQRLRMGEELRRAIAKGQVVPWYQPKVDAVTNQAVGLEALVRWEHPERGMIPPMAFLSVARRAGLMHELSELVVRRAVADAAMWRRNGLDLNVAVNLAPAELLSGTVLPIAYDLIAAADLPAHCVTIEVTEDSFLADPERARDILLDVRRHGLKTSIDDYGTGFSSLAYLRDLPVTELKMDRSFVATVHTDDRSRLIVNSTIDMAHALDLRVVAEGVESAAVAAEVVAMGVDLLQGYHLSAPMPASQVDAWVRGWNEQSMIAGDVSPRLRDSSAS
jgi:diguanylate cyclase (GGDEF)-like protein